MPNIFHNSLSLGYPGGAPSYPTDHIALYKFETNQNDDTGNYNLTAGPGTYSYQAAKVGNGIKYITRGNSGSYGYNTSLVPGLYWTVNFWFKSPTKDHSDIVCGYNGFGGGNSAYRAPGVRIDNNGYIYAFFYANSGWRSIFTGSINYCDGNWHYINHYRNNLVFGISVDNGTVYTGTYTSANGSNYLSINAGAMGTAMVANVEFDQFRFFNRVLSTDEITSLYNSGNGV